MKKRILITGSNGLLGQKLVYALIRRNDVEVIATSKGENRLLNKEGYIYAPLDITIQKEVNDIVERYKPNSIINTAAMTNVDVCETKREECEDLNVNAVRYLSEASVRNDVHMIHLSTDFIFDGEDGPYKEEDQPNPLSFYGLSKYDSEKIIQKICKKWSIIRTIIVYGIVDNMSRSNIVLWAREALAKGQKINVVDDQFRSPTLAEDLADACIAVAFLEKKGIYHVSGKEVMSIVELVEKVADHYGLDKTLINPIKSDTLNQAAKRPPLTGFILDKARKEFGYAPHSFEEGLKILDDQLKLKKP